MHNPHPPRDRADSQPQADRAAAGSATHLYYVQENYADAATGIAAMRHHLVEGWQIAQIRGPSSGPFVVMYVRELVHEPRERAHRRP